MSEPCKLHIGNLDYGATEDDLRKKFDKYGNIEEVIIPLDRDSGRARGFAFVIFENAHDAKDAQQALDGEECCGRDMRVNISKPRTGGGGGGGRGYGGGGRGYGGGGRGYGGRGRGRDGGYSGGRDRYEGSSRDRRYDGGGDRY